MKIAAWNVNSLKVRLPHVLDWLDTQKPDVLCLQETKTEDKGFPFAKLEAAGYTALHNGQKTYNGVALLVSKSMGEVGDLVRDIPDFDDHQKRIIAGTVNGVRIVCAYMPNGSEVGSEKYEYKLRWFKALTEWLQLEMAKYPKLALLGDYNIAPDDRDVHDPAAWAGKILCSEPERAAFKALLDLGLTDSFRMFEQPEKIYSWWDYRMMGFRRNMGMRIDHILLSDPLVACCASSLVDKEPRKLERPSDHAPVVVELSS